MINIHYFFSGSAFRPNLVKPAKPQGEMSSPVKGTYRKHGDQFMLPCQPMRRLGFNVMYMYFSILI